MVGSVTWTAAADQVNGDFESDGTGWTIETGTPQYYNDSDDGGTRAFRGGSSDALTTVSQTLAIPANAARVRLDTWVGITTSSSVDAGMAEIRLYNADDEVIGGVAVASITTDAGAPEEHLLQALVPPDATYAIVYAHAIRGDTGTANNGAVLRAVVEWGIDTTPLFFTTNQLANGDFELGDSPPSSWDHVSGNPLQSVTSASFAKQGTYAAQPSSGSDHVSEQVVISIPPNVDTMYLSAITSGNTSNSDDQAGLRLIFKNSVDVTLDTVTVYGARGPVQGAWTTIFVEGIPAGTASVTVQLLFELRSGSVVNAGVDDVRFIWVDDALIDTSEKLRLRLPNATWLTINPIFQGSGSSGWVPDPGVVSGRFLRDDGTWATPAGGGGGTNDHTMLVNIGTNTHADIDTHIADSTLHFTVGSIDHTAITNVGTNTHAQIDTHIADSTLHFTVGSIDHTAITNVGTNTHAQIDTHIGDSTLHFTVGSIDHAAILNVGSNTHAQIDTHIADSSLHFTVGSIDHTAITNVGTNTHAQIDTHIADSTIHFTVGSIDHGAIANSGVLSHAALDAHVADSTIHFVDTFLENVVEDTTPQLGGDLDADNFELNAVDRIDLVGTGASYTGSTYAPAYLSLIEDQTWAYTGIDAFFGDISISPAVEFAGTHTIDGKANILAGGFLFWNHATVEYTTSGNAGAVYTLVNQATYDAVNATIAAPFTFVDILSAPGIGASGSDHGIVTGKPPARILALPSIV